MAKQPIIHCLLCLCNGWKGWHPLHCQGKAQGLCNTLFLGSIATINSPSHTVLSFTLGRSRIRFTRTSHRHLPSQPWSPLSPCFPFSSYSSSRVVPVPYTCECNIQFCLLYLKVQASTELCRAYRFWYRELVLVQFSDLLCFKGRT